MPKVNNPYVRVLGGRDLNPDIIVINKVVDLLLHKPSVKQCKHDGIRLKNKNEKWTTHSEGPDIRKYNTRFKNATSCYGKYSSEKKTLSETGLNSGDTLIVEEKVNNEIMVQNKPQRSDDARHHTSENKLDCPGLLLKHIVPADNSCLFMSIYFTLNGKTDKTGDVAPYMRQIIAESISKEQDNYSEAILGKPNSEYCKWIKDDKSWGGAIELAILSQYYGIEIAVVDTINGIINKFGEDQRYPHRVLLLFDGIHYDPLYLEPFSGGDIQTIFPTEDDRILKEAEQLAHEAKSSRQFTDVNKFTLKCLVCNIMVSGQTQAQQHAQTTGHMNFGEI